MKVHFDERSDAVYFRLDDSRIVESEEVKPGIILGSILRIGVRNLVSNTVSKIACNMSLFNVD